MTDPKQQDPKAETIIQHISFNKTYSHLQNASSKKPEAILPDPKVDSVREAMIENLQTIKFGQYQALHQIMLQPNFNFSKQTSLDFKSKTYTDTPPGRALKLLPTLRIINLSHNRINRFDFSNLINGAPLLQELDLSHNNIKSLSDIIELGNLSHLNILNFLENPVARKLMRIKIIEFLIFPSKYKPYDPVKLLTATYDYVTDESIVDSKRQEEIKKFERFMERETTEIETGEIRYSSISKSNNKYSVIRLGTKPCPVPRKTRFPMLETLNEEIITVQEIQSILTSNNLAEILPTPDDERLALQAPKQIEREDQKLHEGYVKRYTKKMNRKNDELYSRNAPEIIEENEDEDAELKRLYFKQQRENLLKKPAEDQLWQRPADLQYKNAEYNVSIQEHKRMLQEYEDHKRKKKEEKAKRKKIRLERAKARRDAKQKKGKKDGESQLPAEENPEEEEDLNKSVHSLDSDPEIKKLFNMKIKKKPKLNFARNTNNDPLDSDESSVRENKDEFGTSQNELQNISFTRDKFFDSSEQNSPANSPYGRGLGLKKLLGEKNVEFKALVTSLNGKLEEENQDTVDSALMRQKTMIPTSPFAKGNAAAMIFPIRNPNKKLSHKKKESKTVYVVRESGPNLSLPMYQKPAGAQVENSMLAKSENLQPKEGPEDAQENFNQEESESHEDEDISSEGEDDLSDEENLPTEGPGYVSQRIKSFADVEIPIENDHDSSKSLSNHSEIPTNEMKLALLKHQIKDSSPRAGANTKNSDQYQIEGSHWGLKTASLGSMADAPYESPKRIETLENPDPAFVSGNFNENANTAYTEPDHYDSHMNNTNAGPVENHIEDTEQDEYYRQRAHTDSNPPGVFLVYPKSRNLSPFKGEHHKSSETEPVSPEKSWQVESNSQASSNRPVTSSARQNFAHKTPNRPQTSSINMKKIVRTATDFKAKATSSTQTATSQHLIKVDQANAELNLQKSVQQLALKYNAHQIRQQSQKAFKISNKIFFRHNKTPQSNASTTMTTPKKARPSTSAMKRTISTTAKPAPLEWKLWTPQNAKPTETLANFSSPQNVALSQPDSIKTRQPSIVTNSGLKGSLKEVNEEDLQRRSNGKSVVVKTEPNENLNKKPKKYVREGPKIIVKGPLKITQNLAIDKRVDVDSLIPQPVDGVSEKMKRTIKHSKNGNYQHLTEVAKRLDETSLLIQQAKEIAEQVQVSTGHYRNISYPESLIPYNQLAEFLRLNKKVNRLGFEDNVDIRDLIYSVNDFSRDGEMRYTKLQAEEKLRQMKQRSMNLEGEALHKNQEEIMMLTDYLEILEDTETTKNLHKNNSKQLERAEIQEIERAETNAVLAAHYMKLRKHYGDEYIQKYFKDASEIINNMEANEVNGAKLEFAHKVKKFPNSHYRAYNMGVFEESEPLYPVKKEEEVLLDPYGEAPEKPEPHWLTHSRVKKYVPQAMYSFEEMTEMRLRKKEDRRTKAGHRLLTVEEKMIRYVHDLKEETKNRKEVRTRIDRYVKDGRKDIDGFLEEMRIQNEKTQDKTHCFREFVKLLWENKI